VTGAPDRSQVRLAELVAALSLGIDLGFGQPMEHVLRQCLISLRLAERLGLGAEERAAVYYAALLVNVGCHTDAHEQAKWFGDDISLRSTKYAYSSRGLRSGTDLVRRIGRGNPPLHRFRVGLEFAIGGFRDLDGMVAHHAALARQLADELGLPVAVLDALSASYERWDGHGWPGGLAGEAIPMPSRIAQLAEYLEVADRSGGPGGAVELARLRSGSQFDPDLAAIVRDHADELFDELDSVITWKAVIAAEPALTVVRTGEAIDAALEAIARFVDMKSPYTLGHSGAVADLGAAAATRLGLEATEACSIRRAGLVHHYGRLGVSNSIWDKPGPLGAGEWERVRMNPYFTERMLQHSEPLALLGRIAVQHQERMDGSGYPRGLTGPAISVPGRILGASAAYQAMLEPRPHRPALPAGDAAVALRGEVRAGRLDGEAVGAVLAAAGHRARRTSPGPAGLTSREVQVLRLVARGLAKRQIAAQLSISPKTAANHIEHIYTKISASNRASASLFAVRHGLLPEDLMAVGPVVDHGVDDS
jgi:HD-GYP domain-containing protein (c-di-GMP phosphodiesterase class II)